MSLKTTKPPKVSMSFQQRRIMLCDDINDDSSFEFVNCINRFLYLDKILDTKEPIEIMIDSFGGSVYDGFTIMSKIEELIDLGYEVTTINIGSCFSMGFVIFLCGKIRKSSRYSRFMYHDISSYSEGKLSMIKDDVKELESLIYIINKKVLSCTSLTQKDLDDWRDRKVDKFFSATEALSLNICESIV